MAVRTRRQELSGFFDFWKSKKGFERFESGLPALPAPKSGLPIVRTEQEVIPSPSLLDVVKNLPVIVPPPEAQGMLAPLAEKAALPFGWIEPSLPLPPAKPEEELWAALFEEEAGRPVSIYEAFSKGKKVIPTGRPGDVAEEKRYQRVVWKLPETADIMWAIKSENRDPLDLNGLFEQVLSDTSTSWWKTSVDESAHTGEPAELELMEMAEDENAYGTLADFFDVPEGVLELYFGNPDDFSGPVAFTREVIEPLLDRFSLAMDYLRPPVLRGYFEISPGSDGKWWLKYVEGKFPQEA